MVDPTVHPEVLDLASLEGIYLPYLQAYGKNWPITSKDFMKLQVKALGEDTIIIHDDGMFRGFGGFIFVIRGRRIVPRSYCFRFYMCFFFHMHRFWFDENLDLVNNSGFMHRKSRPWLDRLLQYRGSMISSGDGELAAVAEELSSLDPVEMPIDSRLDYARRLQRGVTFDFLVENMRSDERDEHDFSGPENAFRLVGAELSQANLYCSCASLPPCGFLAGFVSYTWRCCATARSQGLQETLVQCYGTDVDESGVLRWQHAHLWIDKFSSPQSGSGMDQLSRFGFFFQEYIALCPRMFMLLSPEYLSRLWCRFEVVTFLAIHSIDDVYVAVQPFLNDDLSVWASYEEQFRSSSSAEANCTHESDRAVLMKLESDNFHDAASAEQLVKFAILALLGRAFLLSSYPDELRKTDSFFHRLLLICRELGFSSLENALMSIRDSEVLQSCIDRYGDFPSVVRDEFKTRVSPLLLQKQQETMKPASPLQLLAHTKKISRVSLEVRANEKYSSIKSNTCYENETDLRLVTLRRALKWSTYEPGDLQHRICVSGDMDRNYDSTSSKGRVYTDLQVTPRGRMGYTWISFVLFIWFVVELCMQAAKGDVNLRVFIILLTSVTFASSLLFARMRRVNLVKYSHAIGFSLVGVLQVLAGVLQDYPFDFGSRGSIAIGVGIFMFYAFVLYDEALTALGGWIFLTCASVVNVAIQVVSREADPEWHLLAVVPFAFSAHLFSFCLGRRDKAEVIRRNEPFARTYSQLYDAILEKEPDLLEALNQKAAAMQTACARDASRGRQLKGKERVRNLDELYAMAIVVKPLFAKAVDLLCNAVLADPSPPVSIKSPGRAIQKIWRSYGGDVSRLRDVCRGSIVVKDMRRLVRCLEAIDRSEDLEVVDIKNRFRSGGCDRTCYRDVNLRLRVVSSDAMKLGVSDFVVELQLILRSFWKQKTNHGHAEYVRFRDVVAK